MDETKAKKRQEDYSNKIVYLDAALHANCYKFSNGTGPLDKEKLNKIIRYSEYVMDKNFFSKHDLLPRKNVPADDNIAQIDEDVIEVEEVPAQILNNRAPYGQEIAEKNGFSDDDHEQDALHIDEGAETNKDIASLRDCFIAGPGIPKSCWAHFEQKSIGVLCRAFIKGWLFICVPTFSKTHKAKSF